MAGQGWLFKLMTSASAKNYLNVNRGALVNYQQHAGIKQETVAKLKGLNIPEKPKKPLGPFFRYVRDQRDNVLRLNPSLKMVEVNKQCAGKWAEVDQTVKDKYQMEYRNEVEAYTKKHLDYVSQLTDEQSEALKNFKIERQNDKKKREMRKRCKETNKPKRPLTPFMLYLMELAVKENKKMNEVILVSKGKYQELPNEDKQRFEATYLEGKKRYESDMAKWEARMIKEGNVDLIRRVSVPHVKPSRLQAEKGADVKAETDKKGVKRE